MRDVDPRLLTALVLVGVGLRVWAYLANDNFWLDEILLSRNIVGLPLSQLLTQPLYLDQVAPRGFLLAEKLAVALLGESELALRVVPFLCGIAGLLLFRRLAERLLDGWAVPFAVALGAIGVPFIRYASEVKQYELDATLAILLLLVALDLRDRRLPAARLVLLGLAGFLFSWLSQASVIVMAGIGLAFAVEWLLSRDRAVLRVLLIVMPIWAASALVAVAAGEHSMTPSTRDFMRSFWSPGFLPLPFDPATALRWLWGSALSAFSDPTMLRYPWPALQQAVALIGVAAVWRRRRDLALLLAGPLVVALGAAAAQQYPFRGRLMFYLLPGLLLAIAAGAEWIRRLAARGHPAAGTAVMAGLLLAPLMALAAYPPPYKVEPSRAMLAYLQQHRRPGDSIHVFPLARVGMLYYGPRYGIRAGEWRTAICDRLDTRAYLRDVDRYRGTSRLWLLSFAARPYRTARPAVQGYLGTIGVKRDSLSRPSLQFQSVTLELFDLSDSTRLRAATADGYPVAPMPTDPPPGCRPWISPSPADTFP